MPIHIRLACSVSVVLALAGVVGCQVMMLDMSGWDYVHRIGGPEKITEWALQQRDSTRVRDASLALGELSRCDDPDVAAKAVDGIIRINQQLRHGWPDLVEDSDRRPGTRTRAQLIQGNYNSLGHRIRNESSRLHYDAFLAIEPAPDETPWRERWESSARLAGVLPPQEIFDWAVEQNEAEQVRRAQTGLQATARRDWAPEAAATAMEHLIELHVRLRTDWPELQEREHTIYTRRSLVERDYRELAEHAASSDLHRKAFMAIEPDPNEPTWRELWERYQNRFSDLEN